MAVALKEKSSKSQLVEKKLAPNENARRIFVFGIVRTKPIPMLAPWLTVRARSLPYFRFGKRRRFWVILWPSVFFFRRRLLCVRERSGICRERARESQGSQAKVRDRGVPAAIRSDDRPFKRTLCRLSGQFDVDETLRARC